MGVPCLWVSPVWVYMTSGNKAPGLAACLTSRDLEGQGQGVDSAGSFEASFLGCPRCFLSESSVVFLLGPTLPSL